MADTTLTTPDLDVGEQVEVALVPGPELRKLRVFASSAAPGGVTAVTATAPLTSTGGATPNLAITPATELAAGSMSAADKTKLDGLPSDGNLWPFDAPITAAAVRPGLTQAQSTTGAGQTLVVGPTQAAETGSSGARGGDILLLFGNSDGGFNPLNPGPFAWIGVSTGPGTDERVPTNYFNYAIFKWLGSGVMNLLLGGGSNNIGGGVTAVEVSAFTPISVATENNSPISFGPSNGVGQSTVTLLTDSNQGPVVQLAGFGSAFPSARGGMLRIPWESSSSQQEILDQRNSTNTADLSILSRQTGVLTHGSLSEPQNFYGQAVINYKIDGAGAGHAFSGVNGAIVTLATDPVHTIVQGDSFPVQFDSQSTQGPFQADTTSTAANQTIALIDLPAGTQTYALTHLFVKIEALDESTGNFATFSHRWAFTISGGVVTAPTGAQPAAVDDGHSAGAGTSIAPQFAIVGSQIAVQVTPWTASGIHWTVFDDRYVNAGKKPVPTTPPGSPVYWFRADLQGLGVATQMSDFSGNGNNLTHLVAGTARTVTAGSGPGGTLPSLQFPTSAIYQIASALGIGPKNFTIAIVGQVTSTSSPGQQSFVVVGNGANDGTAVGVNLDLTGQRGAIQPDGVSSNTIDDGPATTAWEAWVFSSDAAGNLTLLVNGVNQPLAPSNQIGTAPAAEFNVGGSGVATQGIIGAIFEIIAYDNIESSAAIYVYQHAITGL